MPQLRKAFLFSIVLVSLFGCLERSADIENSNSYANNGVSFEYPGNWKVTADHENEDYRFIFIESPGDAISKIEIYPKGVSFSLSEFAELDIEALKSNLSKFFGVSKKDEIVEITKAFDGRTFTGYEYKFNVSLLGVDTPHISEFYRSQSDSVNAYITNQVSVEDLEKVNDGFMQIIRNFKAEDALSD